MWSYILIVVINTKSIYTKLISLNIIGMVKNLFDADRKRFNHYIIELFNIKGNYLNNHKEIANKILLLLKILDLNVVKIVNHKYTPQGLTTAFVLSSSHLIVHTWPEYNYLHIDLFTCSAIKNEKETRKIINSLFIHKEMVIRKIKYGK